MVDLSGQQIGEWAVLNRCENLGKRTRFICKCSCGIVKAVLSQSLTNKKSNNCGHDRIIKIIKGTTKHNMSHSTEYRIWRGMLNRCFLKSHESFKHYGERGISVCKKWCDSFDNFYADMGPRPSLKYSLDRKNNDGNYELSNCQWATKSQQGHNKRLIKNQGVRKYGEKFQSRIRLKEKYIHLGTFNTKEEAHAAYLTKKQEIMDNLCK